MAGITHGVCVVPRRGAEVGLRRQSLRVANRGLNRHRSRQALPTLITRERDWHEESHLVDLANLADHLIPVFCLLRILCLVRIPHHFK